MLFWILRKLVKKTTLNSSLKFQWVSFFLYLYIKKNPVWEAKELFQQRKSNLMLKFFLFANSKRPYIFFCFRVLQRPSLQIEIKVPQTVPTNLWNHIWKELRCVRQFLQGPRELLRDWQSQPRGSFEKFFQSTVSKDVYSFQRPTYIRTSVSGNFTQNPNFLIPDSQIGWKSYLLTPDC